MKSRSAHAPAYKSVYALIGGFMLTVALLSVGCSSGGRIDVDDIRANMTPELQTTAMTSSQHKTRIARAVDHNLRQIWDDLDYIFLIDQPSHLTEYPIP